MWRSKHRKQRKPSESHLGLGKAEEQARAEPPDSPTNQQDQIMRLAKSGMRRTALDEVLRGLRQDPGDFFLLQLGATIASTSRTDNQRAAEPTTSAQRRSALLTPAATECSSCKRTWYSSHWASPSPDGIDFLMNLTGLQCKKCRYTLCRDCLDREELAPDDQIDKPITVMGACPKLGHGLLGTPVLPTGRSDVTSIKPDYIEAVIVIRDGPIPPTMDEALDVVPRFVPLIADDAPLIHIRPSKPGLIAEKSGREELAITRVHDLEHEGLIALGAWSRSEYIFAKIPGADTNGSPAYWTRKTEFLFSTTSYLLTVVRKADSFVPRGAKALAL